MNVSKILSDLYCELQLVEEAIAGLECIARNRARRPGSLSKWIAKSEPPAAQGIQPRHVASGSELDDWLRAESGILKAREEEMGQTGS